MFCRYWASELDSVFRFTSVAAATGSSEMEFSFCPDETCCKA